MKHKTDINIGKRAGKFIYFKFNNISDIEKHGISRKLYYEWLNNGAAPSAYHLKKLCELGADPFYILTGRSKKNDS